MRGLDGNYLNTQGDATARMQVAYQAEVDRQQLKAQLEGMESLRKLREQVNEAEKEEVSSGPRLVTEDHGTDSHAQENDMDSYGEKARSEKEDGTDGQEEKSLETKTHIDIRV